MSKKFERAWAERQRSILVERQLADRLAVDEIKKATSAMLKKACAINNGKKCFKGCIHFSEAGNVYYIDYDKNTINENNIRIWAVELPYCKLWNENDRETTKLVEINWQ